MSRKVTKDVAEDMQSHLGEGPTLFSHLFYAHNVPIRVLHDKEGVVVYYKLHRSLHAIRHGLSAWMEGYQTPIVHSHPGWGESSYNE